MIAPPHTFIATIEAIAATGARPLLADIDPATGCLDPAAALAAATPATAALVAVRLYGRPARMGALAAAGVPVLEDAAQAQGATLDGRRVGSLGAAAAFSFYPTKNLGAFGDAGAVTSDDESLLETVRSLRHHGSDPADANRHVLAGGGTERLDNLQAAVLRVKLRALDARNAARRTAAERTASCSRASLSTSPPTTRATCTTCSWCRSTSATASSRHSAPRASARPSTIRRPFTCSPHCAASATAPATSRTRSAPRPARCRSRRSPGSPRPRSMPWRRR